MIGLLVLCRVPDGGEWKIGREGERRIEKARERRR